MFIGIAATIPALPNLPGQGGGGPEVTLDYSSSNFCADASDPTLSDASPVGGVFSYTGVGTLDLNASNGAIDISDSDPGNYTVIYTVIGVGDSSFPINITAVQDSSFSYSASAFCKNASNQTPTIITPGGSFTTQDITFYPFQLKFDVSAAPTISIPTTGSNFTVDWGDGTVTTETGGTISHSYGSGLGDVIISIGAKDDTGPFTAMAMRRGSGSEFREVVRWGSIQWSTFAQMFRDIPNLQITATDVPDLSLVNTYVLLFYNGNSNQPDLSNWDVSNSTDFSSVFRLSNFNNSSIENWDVSNGTTLSSMFWMSSFNGDLSNWDVSSVIAMPNVFAQSAFNNDSIENWNTASLTSLNGPFYKNYGLDVNLSNWNILNFSNTLTSNWAYRTGISTENYTDTIVGWAVQVYNNNNSPTGINAAGSGKTFDGTRTSDNKAGQAYNVKYSNWPSGWTTAQDAYNYLVNTTNWSL